jgi:hypothetical protein
MAKVFMTVKGNMAMKCGMTTCNQRCNEHGSLTGLTMVKVRLCTAKAGNTCRRFASSIPSLETHHHRSVFDALPDSAFIQESQLVTKALTAKPSIAFAIPVRLLFLAWHRQGVAEGARFPARSGKFLQGNCLESVSQKSP